MYTGQSLSLGTDIWDQAILGAATVLCIIGCCASLAASTRGPGSPLVTTDTESRPDSQEDISLKSDHNRCSPFRGLKSRNYDGHPKR